MSSDLYYQGGRSGGKCSVCGTEKTYTYRQKGGKKSGKTFAKPFYFRVFEKMDWFRGNDEYRGTICKNCIKARRLAEARKQLPAPPKQEVDKEGTIDNESN